jgi:hypothetical protein
MKSEEVKKAVEFNSATSKMFVKFKKKDNTIREMVFTTSKKLIPEEKLPKGDVVISSPKKAAARVFDLEAQDWRSFRYDSVIDIKITELLTC